ncbi:hypothetical protein [Streptomyces oceani]
MAGPGDGGSPTDEWERVQNFPGLKASTVTRHTFVQSIVPD